MNRNPIINKARDYWCSVLGLDLPLNSIPTMIMPILPPPNNVNNWSPITFGIFYSGINTSAPIIFEPQNSYPAPPAGGQ